MSTWQQKIDPLVIPNGTADSNALVLDQYEDAVSIGILAPAALDAFTFTFEVSDIIGGTWRTLEVGDSPADAVPPLAGKARRYVDLSNFPTFRIHSSANVAAERTWEVIKYWKPD